MIRMFRYLLLFYALCSGIGFAQSDTAQRNIDLSGDFRFRIEQDWRSQKSDGTWRDDRTRMRYRFRFGVNYTYNPFIKFGFRIRTGLQNKQQDPQLTLGDLSDWGTLPLGFEKIYFDFNKSGWNIWLGKNTFPFQKQNELFWSDHVYPEGIFLSYKYKVGALPVDLRLGHFILNANGKGLDTDGYLQAVQLTSKAFKERLSLMAGYFYFHQMPDIPDGFATRYYNYGIAHFATGFQLTSKLKLEADYWQNVLNMQQSTQVVNLLADQRSGYAGAIAYGALKEKGHWKFKLTYAYLERFAIVDFLAQNDWVRWDYGTYGSPDGRLSNYQGIEAMVGYALGDKMVLKAKYYWTEQLLRQGAFLENGQRFRVDIDISL